jgi:hypothetical protein
LTAISGLPRPAPALGGDQPTITPPIRPGPGGGGDRVDLGQLDLRLGEHLLDQRGRISTWARAAISGTTPP